MTITFYINYDEKNKLSKNLSNPTPIDGTLREPASITHPVLTVQADSMVGLNYCYIPQFDRYYFVEDVVAMTDTIWKISCKVDVLQSFRNEIAGLTAIVDRAEQEKDSSYYINGDAWIPLVKDKTDIIQFSNGLLETGEYILITAGG